MRKWHKRGFTLVEVVVSLAILGIVTAMAFTYFMYNTKIYTMAHYEATIQSECTEIMELLTVAAKESSDIALSPKVNVDDPDEYVFTRDATLGGDVVVTRNINRLTIEMNGERYEYDFIAEFTIAGAGNLREIRIVGRRHTEARSFTTTVSMRNQ